MKVDTSIETSANSILLNNFLDRSFFKTWKDPEHGFVNYKRLELIVTSNCNLGCKYCYLSRFGDKLYPEEIRDSELIMCNLDMVIDWLIENKMTPNIDLFSGELFYNEIGFKAIERILERYENVSPKIAAITVPSNFTFIQYPKFTERVEAILLKGKELGITIFLSASFDGKFCETNRPMIKGNDNRDDEYYDKVFAFIKKWNCGIHPMIYSETIHNWKKNFLWFQEMMAKHDIPWYILYLLEVRNANWSVEETKAFGDFYRFITRWAYLKCGEDKQKFEQFIFKFGFNTIKGVFSTIGRGLGCSIQSMLYVRLGDLAIVPCHRLSYSPFIIGNLEPSCDKILEAKAKNIELLIALQSLDAKNLPYCESCVLNHLCSLPCLGSNYETTGDIFTPIPTVCQLEHVRVKAILEELNDIGILGQLLLRISPEKAGAIHQVLDIEGDK